MIYLKSCQWFDKCDFEINEPYFFLLFSSFSLFIVLFDDVIADTLRYIQRSIQLFRERLSEKVHATIPKGIVGGFEFTVLQRNLKELARKAMKMCLRVLSENKKSRFASYSRQEQCIDHIPITFRDCRVHNFCDNLSRNSCICMDHTSLLAAMIQA